MSLVHSSSRSAPESSGVYRFCRGVLRLWFSLNFRRIRVLEAAHLTGPAGALLVVNHPPSFLDTLILIAAFDRQVSCLLEGELLRGPARRLLAHSLGVIAYAIGDDQWPSVLESCSQILSRGGAVLVFARQPSKTSEEPARFAPAAAAIASEAATAVPSLSSLPVHAVHLYLPVPPSQAAELLIHVDAPVSLESATPNSEGGAERGIDRLDSELERVCLHNPFRLQPETLEQFLAGLEEVMREDFEETWARRPNSRQRVEDFEISPFLSKLVGQLNHGHPGRLVALGEALDAYLETRRRLALTALRAETAGGWLGSGWRRIAAWVETIAGFPVAVYGLLNLLIAWLVLHVSGLLHAGLWNATAGQWTARVIVALACYAGQIAIVSYLLPRSAAGYYALSLPISGVYLLRYLWLLENRTNVVALSLRKGTRMQRLRRMRKSLIEELKRDQDRFAALWNVAH